MPAIHSVPQHPLRNAKPYARHPFATGTLVDQLEKHRNRQRYDINANETENADPAIAILLDDDELKTVLAYQDNDALRCDECDLLIAPLGCGEYVPKKERNNELHPTSQVCKACWPYSMWNLVKTVEGPAPPCTCPPGSVAGEEVDSGCCLHVVPAVNALPRGTTEVLRRPSHWKAVGILADRFDAAYAAFDALRDQPLDTPEREAAWKACEKASALVHKLSNIPYELFDIRDLFEQARPVPANTPSATSRFSVTHTPQSRKYAAKIPAGHAYDYRRTEKVPEGDKMKAEELFKNYANYA
ncbi:hypothetical protein B0H11DRAFT_2238064 [Mycena galericulata]|nr:hypothetical protein B0H11DRAFT_2263106 [Mycena galericulata]KAJ7469923.1 hypothetical protein B0H11DRAFT_2238064 [Mycena galericulata]